MGNSSANAEELLRDGLQREKAGQPEKALELYRAARRDLTDAVLLAESWRLEAYAQHGLNVWDEAVSAARRSGEIAREAGRDDLVAEALNAEAAVHVAQGALEEARLLYEAMLELTDAPRVRGLALQNLGILHGQRDELELADRRFREAYDEFERAAYAWGKAHVLNNTVAVAIKRQEYELAEEMGRAAVRLARRVDDLDLLAIATLNLAEALAGMGHLESAQEQASIALGHFDTSGNVWRRVTCLRILGDMSARLDDEATARAFWSRGVTLAREIGAEGEMALLEVRMNPR